MQKLFAVCSPGLEPFTALELRRLNLLENHSLSRPEDAPPGEDPGREFGGIEFQGSLHDIYRTNLRLRTASRVLIRLGQFYASAFPELRRKAGLLPWEKYLAPERPVALRVACQKSRLYHEGAVAERVAAAMLDKLGQANPIQRYREESGSDPPQLILVRIVDNLCTISVDSSGALLHRRGYRLATAKAPVRETLASAMVLASGWNPPSPLLDPFCGSGTIPIEAAMMAKGILPGAGRRFAFMDWPDFDATSWDNLLAETRKEAVSVTPNIIASDRDAGAIRSAKTNAERAGVSDCIEFSCRPISAIDPPSAPGSVVTNPPYGVRLSKTKDLRNLYAQFGNVLRARCPGWEVTMICDRIQLIHSTGLPFDKGIPVMSGGLKVNLVKCRV